MEFPAKPDLIVVALGTLAPAGFPESLQACG